MPRNGAGVFTLAQPPFQPSTPISSSAMNSDLSDIADGLTASVARDGQSPMTGTLQLSQTGFTYSVDPNTGIRRSGADAQGVLCGGSTVVEFSTTAVEFSVPITRGGVPVTPTPSGVISLFAGAVAPAGYLLCNGQAVSRTTYATLFTAIGTQYGAGDGSTTFNIPNTTGRVPGGLDASATVTPGLATLGATTGAAAITLSGAQFPPHYHEVFLNDTGHSHVFGAAGNAIQSGPSPNFQVTGSGGSATQPAVTGITIRDQAGGLGTANRTAVTGGGTAHDNVQPTIAFNYIIKT